jgi:hypothetical protein
LYARIYSDSDGESHFQDLDGEFHPVDFAPPAPHLDVSVYSPAVRYAFVHAASGWSGDWHPSPRRQLRFVIGGES